MTGLRANWWLYLAAAGFLGYLDPLPSGLRLLNLIFLWPLVRAVLRRRTRPRGKEPPVAPAAGGPLRFLTRLVVSEILLYLVPRTLAQIVRQFFGDRRAAPRAIPEPAGYGQKARYSLPFRGEWYVLKGRPDEESSHSWDIVAQRYAFDFVMADRSLRRWREGAGSVSTTTCATASRSSLRRTGWWRR